MAFPGVSLALCHYASPSSMFSVSPAGWRESTRANYFGTHCEIILKCTRNRALSNFGNNILPIKSLPTSLVDFTDHPERQFLDHTPFLRKESRFTQPTCSLSCVPRLNLGIPFPIFRTFGMKFKPIGAPYFVRRMFLSLTVITPAYKMRELTA